MKFRSEREMAFIRFNFSVLIWRLEICSLLLKINVTAYGVFTLSDIETDKDII